MENTDSFSPTQSACDDGGSNAPTSAQGNDNNTSETSADTVTGVGKAETKRTPRPTISAKRTRKDGGCSFAITFRGAAQTTLEEYARELAPGPITTLIEAHFERLIAELQVDLVAFASAREAAQQKVRDEARAAVKARYAAE